MRVSQVVRVWVGHAGVGPAGFPRFDVHFHRALVEVIGVGNDPLIEPLVELGRRGGRDGWGEPAPVASHVPLVALLGFAEPVELAAQFMVVANLDAGEVEVRRARG